jgi:hypothetical protein
MIFYVTGEKWLYKKCNGIDLCEYISKYALTLPVHMELLKQISYLESVEHIFEECVLLMNVKVIINSIF